MKSLDVVLESRLESIRQDGLWREMRPVESAQEAHLRGAGVEVVNFSSNDYLGLAAHAALKEAAGRAVARFGGGSGASRLISGSLPPHRELEDALARFKGSESALVFSSGYAAAVGAIPALMGPEDVIILDRLAHACLIDAARMSRARLRVFRHNDLDQLRGMMEWARNTVAEESRGEGNILLVTESVFSMDGDTAPLAEMVALKEELGAWMLVDEAHATGLFGEHRRGRLEAEGIAGGVEIQMGTLGKALGSAGGFLCGSRNLRQFLIHRARSFIFSTAPVPAASAAATAAVELVQSEEGRARCALLWDRIGQAREGLAALGIPLPVSPAPIIPIPIGEEGRAVEIGKRLFEAGFWVPAVRYPTVGRGLARLRLSLSAGHTAGDIDYLLAALRGLSLGR